MPTHAEHLLLNRRRRRFALVAADGVGQARTWSALALPGPPPNPADLRGTHDFGPTFATWREVLAARRRLGDDHPDTWKSMNSLAAEPREVAATVIVRHSLAPRLVR
jgi:hypothetical protein